MIANRPWHAVEAVDALAALESTPDGLHTPECQRRLRQYGPNVLEDVRPPSAVRVFLRQFASPLIAILLVATVVTVLLQEWVDAGVIAAVLLLNAVIGFAQERKADAAVRALMQMSVPRARVLRDGQERDVDGRDLVPGDVVLLESGTRVPADLRLVRAQSLLVDESLLTGESASVVKHTRVLDPELPLGDRGSVAHAGSMVASGRGTGVVYATGTRTELGGIAELLRSEVDTETPLTLRMTRLSRLIMAVVLVSCAAVFALGLATGGSVQEMFLAAVALAVAAVPEGLPIVLTIALALGVTRMARRKAIVRRLPAVETLGSATVIGSDKTGTLTENRMTARELWAGGRTRDPGGAVAGVTARGHAPDAVPVGGHVPARTHRAEGVLGGPPPPPASPLDLDPAVLALLTGVLTNEATLHRDADGPVMRGDPTEIALLVAAADAGLEPDVRRDTFGLVADLPFEPERRYSATLRQWGDGEALFVKGAPERVLDMCDTELGPDGPRPLDAEAAHTAERAMAARGLRVLGLAVGRPPGAGGPRGASSRTGAEAHHRDDDPAVDLTEPAGLTFVGLVGLMDPPRAGVREAVAACADAGVRVVMITGDHADTAAAIAAELGIADRSDRVVTGSELDAMSDRELTEAVAGTRVYARVSPEGKLRIVRALQERGEVVAVTGDGVNDAPALKAASIGVAMGEGGTDVAREAAEIVLADDNFVSIVGAIEQGRITFENVRRATFFLISTALAAILALVVTIPAGWPLLMLPAQLLWLNLVTNGLQDVALAFERGERDVLRQRPRPAREGIMSRLLWERAVITAVVMGLGTIVMFRWALEETGSVTIAQTVALTTLVLFTAFQAGNARSGTRSVLAVPLRDNPFLVVVTAATMALHAAALYFPPTQMVLRVEPLPLDMWPRMVAVAAAVLVVVEAEKAVRWWLARSGWRRKAPARTRAAFDAERPTEPQP